MRLIIFILLNQDLELGRIQKAAVFDSVSYLPKTQHWQIYDIKRAPIGIKAQENSASVLLMMSPG